VAGPSTTGNVEAVFGTTQIAPGFGRRVARHWIRRGTFKSVRDLVAKIENFVQHYNHR